MSILSKNLHLQHLLVVCWTTVMSSSLLAVDRCDVTGYKEPYHVNKPATIKAAALFPTSRLLDSRAWHIPFFINRTEGSFPFSFPPTPSASSSSRCPASELRRHHRPLHQPEHTRASRRPSASSLAPVNLLSFPPQICSRVSSFVEVHWDSGAVLPLFLL